jgi:hypothetical protein
VLPDLGKLINAIEMKLAAIDINSQQAAQTTVRQFKAIDIRGDETASAFQKLAERTDSFNRTLSWHLTIVRRMSRWIGSAELADGHRQGPQPALTVLA